MAKPTPRIRKSKVRARLENERVKRTREDSFPAESTFSTDITQGAKKSALREHLQSHSPFARLSQQKKKRLEKYLDTKLKRDENQDLIRKLSQQSFDTSILKSSKKLGRVSQTRKEALASALQSKRHGNDASVDDLIFEPRGSPNASVDSEGEERTVSKRTAEPVQSRQAPIDTTSTTPNGFGSGLKRPLDVDEDGLPIIQSRKRLKSNLTRSAKEVPRVEDEWEGFSSEEDQRDVAVSDGQDSEDYSSDDQDDVSEASDPPSEDSSDSDDSEDASDNNETSSDEEGQRQGTERMSNFKAWALSQRDEASGYRSAAAPDLMSAAPAKLPSVVNKPQMPKIPDLSKPQSQRPGRHAYHVPVNRMKNINEARAALPMAAKEQEIMDAIFNNDCTIVTGATGSGKTTQVPQFLFEAGYGYPGSPAPGMIGITQPRRVAAVSMAKRVSEELGDHGDRVSHQIRFDSTVGVKTALKFMTDGVLLREVAEDFVLTKYSVIVVDEAHERSVNTDILIGMLCRIVETRKKLSSQPGSKYKPLKLVIMSATLSVADFTNNTTLFRTGKPPVVEAEGKTFPVVTHFSRRTHWEYLEDAIQKVARGHRKLPPGGMLVFLTGQNEIVETERKLKEMFEPTELLTDKRPKMRVSAAEAAVETEDVDFGLRAAQAANEEDDTHETGEDLDFDVDAEETRVLQKVHVLPLYSQLSSEQQMRVFEPLPANSRLIVLATNVAETSLTIPGIRYVFDCGRAKSKTYDPDSGVQSFDVDWISKASAEQRRGRAGRTGPGHCYRLYSSAVYENHFAAHTTPEILRVPIESVVLQLKSMTIPNVAQFPFPTPPDRSALMKAQRLLENLKAIKGDTVTDVGKQLSFYPISPRLARVLVSALNTNCLEHTIALVSVMSAEEVFIPHARFHLENEDTDSAEATETSQALQKDKRKQAYNAFHTHASRSDKSSDALKLLTTFCDFTADPLNAALNAHTYTKRLREAQQLRGQLTRLVNSNHTLPRTLHAPTPLPTPTSAQAKTLRTLLAAGFLDQVAQRADLSPTPPQSDRIPAHAGQVPYLPLTPLPRASTTVTGAAATDLARYAYIYPGSALAHTPAARAPQYVLYTHLSRGPAATVGGGTVPRTRLHPLGSVEGSALAAMARGTPLLVDSKPIGAVEALARSKSGEERRRVWATPLLRAEGGVAEWPLPPARRVVQVRRKMGGWVEEDEA